MTRLLTTGYETGDANESGTTNVGASGAVAVVTATPAPRAGGAYCLKCTGALSSGVANKTFVFTSKTEIWLRFGVWAHPGATSEQPMAVLNDSLGNAQASLSFNSSDSLIRARQGGTTGGTLLGTASSAMSQDAWHLVEWRHQMTSATVGITEVWLDGTRVINFSGDNTATTTVNVAQLIIGWTSNSATGAYYGFDDIAINDTSGTLNNGQVGDGRVVFLRPNGVGSNASQTRGGTDSGANWNQCDEVPPSMTDYVFSATAGTRDTYALTDLPAGSWTVNCCEVVAYAQNSDVGAGSLGLTVKSSSTTNEGSAQALGTTTTYYRQLYETDPATSAAWATAAVNALEAGTTVR